MKKNILYFSRFLLLAIISLSLLFSFSCSNNQIKALEERIEKLEEENAKLRAQGAEEEPEEFTMTEAPEEEVMEEAAEEEFEIAPELEFFFTDQFPTEIWGKVKIIEPLLIEFSDVLVEKGSFLLSDEEARITGKVSGLDTIKYTLFPDKGLFTMLSGVIYDDSGRIKWEQDGYPIDDCYIAEGEIRDFLLINRYRESIDPSDNLVILAYLEGGMIEDLDAGQQKIDKGVFGIYIGNCFSLEEEAENTKEEPKIEDEVQEKQTDTNRSETETQTQSNIQPIIDSVSDNLGHVNTNSWAKDTGGDWSSGGINASPTIYIGDTLVFAINVSDSSNLQYRFQYQAPGGSFKTIKDWSSSSGCSWTVPSDAYGKWTVVNLQVRNNDGLNYLGFCDDYTYMTYIILNK